MLLPPRLLKTRCEFGIFVLLNLLLLKECKAHMHLSHAIRNYPC